MGVAQRRGVLLPMGATVVLLGCGGAQNVTHSTLPATSASMSPAATTTPVAPSVTSSEPTTSRRPPATQRPMTFPTPPPSSVTVAPRPRPVPRPQRPEPNAVSTVPVTRPPPPPIPQGREYRTIADVIETADGGPQIAFLIEASLPPQGYGIALASWDWNLVDGEGSAGGTTWTTHTVELVGTWDGTVFRLTEPPAPATRPGVERGTPMEGCDLGRLAAMVDELFRANVGVYSAGYGGCVVNIEAIVDSPELREALEPLGDAAYVTYALQPAG